MLPTRHSGGEQTAELLIFAGQRKLVTALFVWCRESRNGALQGRTVGSLTMIVGEVARMRHAAVGRLEEGGAAAEHEVWRSTQEMETRSRRGNQAGDLAESVKKRVPAGGVRGNEGSGCERRAGG